VDKDRTHFMLFPAGKSCRRSFFFEGKIEKGVTQGRTAFSLEKAGRKSPFGGSDFETKNSNPA